MEPVQPTPTAFKHGLALDLALQHPALSTDPRVLCTAAQACKAWQQAVQHCSACNTVVVLGPTVSLQQACSFKRWLFKHPGLVKSLPANDHDVRRHDHHLEALQALLQQAVEQAAWMPAATTAAATATAPAAALETKEQQQGQQQLQCGLVRLQQGLLRLASFSSNLPGAPSMLMALATGHLTHLHLLLQRSTAAEGLWLAAALPQLTSLQQVHFGARYRMSGSWLAAVSHLTRLTSLKVTGGFTDTQQPLQQVLAQPLPLRILHIWSAWEEPALDLSGLTRLEDLKVAVHPGQTVLPLQLKGLSAANRKPLPDLSALTQLEHLTAAIRPGQTVLPPQLQSLRVANYVKGDMLAAVKPLQQLRSLHLRVDFEQQLLLGLGKLPSLQHLSLEYYEVEHAAGTAAAWPLLPQLQVWWDDGDDDLPDDEEMAVIWGGALACTGLTRLCFGAQNREYDSDSVAVCAGLARLTRLKELTLHSFTSLVPGDVQALTALTALTRLALNGVDGVEEADIAALARSMPQLQHLELGGLDLSSVAFMAAVGTLTQLTELSLENSDMTEQSLLQLTGLVHLQVLHPPTYYGAVTKETVDRLWSAVQKQRQLL